MKRYQLKQWLYWNVWRKYVLRVLLFAYFPACNYHKNDSPIDYAEYPPSCPECGKLIYTKPCPRCGKEFIDWASSGADDVMGSASCSESGDFMCSDCARRYDEYEESHDEDGYPNDWDEDELEDFESLSAE